MRQEQAIRFWMADVLQTCRFLEESTWDLVTDRRKQRPDEYHQEQWPMLKASILVRVL